MKNTTRLNAAGWTLFILSKIFLVAAASALLWASGRYLRWERPLQIVYAIAILWIFSKRWLYYLGLSDDK